MNHNKADQPQKTISDSQFADDLRELIRWDIEKMNHEALMSVLIFTRNILESCNPVVIAE